MTKINKEALQRLIKNRGHILSDDGIKFNYWIWREDEQRYHILNEDASVKCYRNVEHLLQALLTLAQYTDIDVTYSELQISNTPNAVINYMMPSVLRIC